MSTHERTTARGRPEATTHTAIEQAAFRLFARKGFRETTLDDIAAEVGVGKRTLFRYYPSKNDIPWGQFPATLERFRITFDDMPTTIPVHQAVQRAVIEFNRFPDDAQPSHRQRMHLILRTPELQAHSVHQYVAWRAVIERYVAYRCACPPTDITPRLAGHLSLALALTAYESWLDNEVETIIEALGNVMRRLSSYLST